MVLSFFLSICMTDQSLYFAFLLSNSRVKFLCLLFFGWQVHIFNTHLSLSHEAREESVSQIIQFMKESGEDEPALLMGDLNASPEEKAIRQVCAKDVMKPKDITVLLVFRISAEIRGFRFPQKFPRRKFFDQVNPDKNLSRSRSAKQNP